MKRGESGINCLFAVDKPKGPSSHDVVAHVRRALGERRVGHAGTLDPSASGVLVIGVGQGTRLLGMLTLDEKTYEARIDFGAETTTDDAEGEPTVTAAVPEGLRDEAMAHREVHQLVGEHDQVPPAFSAISVDGKRAYSRARSGEQVELAPRHIVVYDADLLRIEEEGERLSWWVRLHVSKGTYVRSIARDLGRTLGTAAHVGELRRCASGVVREEQCLSLEELDKLGASGAVSRCLDPVATLGLPFRSLSEQEADDAACGRRLDAGLCIDRTGQIRTPHEGERLSLIRGNALVGVWQCAGSILQCVANFPSGIVGVRRG